MTLSYIKLFLTIYLSISLAGITVFLVKDYQDTRALELAVKQMETIAAEAKFDLERATFMQKLKNAKGNQTTRSKTESTPTLTAQRNYTSSNEVERRRKQEARRTNNEVCGFWRKEYNKEHSKYNKSMMDGACYRALYD